MTTSPTKRARNARGHGARLRAEIVAAALSLVDQGTSPLTLRALAREAGIAAPSIYNHFSGVPEVLSAVSAECFAELDRAMLAARDPLGDPVARLEAVCHAYLDWAEAHAGRYALMFGRPPAVDDELPDGGGPAANSERAAPVYATLFASLAECVRALRSASREPYGDALALWSGLHGLAGLRISEVGPAWPENADLAAGLIRRLAQVAG